MTDPYRPVPATEIEARRIANAIAYGFEKHGPGYWDQPGEHFFLNDPPYFFDRMCGWMLTVDSPDKALYGRWAFPSSPWHQVDVPGDPVPGDGIPVVPVPVNPPSLPSPPLTTTDAIHQFFARLDHLDALQQILIENQGRLEEVVKDQLQAGETAIAACALTLRSILQRLDAQDQDHAAEQKFLASILRSVRSSIATSAATVFQGSIVGKLLTFRPVPPAPKP